MTMREKNAKFVVVVVIGLLLKNTDYRRKKFIIIHIIGIPVIVTLENDEAL